MAFEHWGLTPLLGSVLGAAELPPWMFSLKANPLSGHVLCISG